MGKNPGSITTIKDACVVIKELVRRKGTFIDVFR
jgi:Tfp pilus assembly protein PilP